MMGNALLLANQVDRALYRFNKGTSLWETFSPQPSWTKTAIAPCVLGLPTGEVIAHDGLDASGKYVHLNPATGVWTQYSPPAGGNYPQVITGLVASDLWALTDQGKVHRFSAGAWTQHATGFGTNAPRLIHQSATSRVWLAVRGGTVGLSLRCCTDGVNWTDVTAAVITALGSDPGCVGGAWTSSAGKTYFGTYYGRVFYFDESDDTYHEIATGLNSNHNCCGLWGADVSVVIHLWWLHSNAGYGYYALRHHNGTSWADVLSPGAFGPVSNPISSYPSALDVVAVCRPTGAKPKPHIASDGATFTEIDPSATSSDVGVGVQTYAEVPIALSNLDPAADEQNVAANTTIGFDVTCLNGITEAATIISVDGVTVWNTGAEVSPYDVVETAITHGYRYLITMPSSFPPLHHTSVRVRASAALGSETLDETYHFDVAGAAESVDDTDGFTQLITDAGDYELDARGNLLRDATPASRCRVRLVARRLRWPHDATLGSRFAEAANMREAKRKAQQWAAEALKPLVDEGAITTVEVVEVADDASGEFDAHIQIGLPSGETQSIVGTFKGTP